MGSTFTITEAGEDVYIFSGEPDNTGNYWQVISIKEWAIRQIKEQLFF